MRGASDFRETTLGSRLRGNDAKVASIELPTSLNRTRSNQKSKMEIKPIRIMSHAGVPPVEDELACLNTHFRALATALQESMSQRGHDPEIAIALDLVGVFLSVMTRLNHEYGADAELPIAGVSDAVDDTLRALLTLESGLIRYAHPTHLTRAHALEIGCGYWAMRHGLTMYAVEPIVNALAAQANAATSTRQTAAIYAMMQGFIQHFLPQLYADLERSNLERPWRLLNLNFAITAIRTGDVGLMRFAFDTLNAHLPFDLPGFYQDARRLAEHPGFPENARTLIDGEFSRWTRAH